MRPHTASLPFALLAGLLRSPAPKEEIPPLAS
jgi:hypothetical protein